MRMFPDGAAQMHESWLKGFSSGAHQTSPKTLGIVIVWLSGLSAIGYSTIALFVRSNSSTTLFLLPLIYAILAIQLFYIQRRIGNYSFLSAVLYPLSLTYFHALFFIGVFQKLLGIRTSWRGRHVS